MAEVKKVVAQEALGYFFERLSSDPGNSDVAESIQKSYQVLK
ncbi:hypothetical protein [Synechococcus sp. MIT S9504]|nr:hypothetical protein [Synechococcus sp. MIT S9504]